MQLTLKVQNMKKQGNSSKINREFTSIIEDKFLIQELCPLWNFFILGSNYEYVKIHDCKFANQSIQPSVA